MKKKSNVKGITLIALVITIIVLLILAGAAVSIGLDSDGIFARANKAVERWNTDVENENTTLINYIEHLNEFGTVKKEPTTDVYTVVCKNNESRLLLFSNNTDDIYNYLSVNNMEIINGHEIENIRNHPFYNRYVYETDDFETDLPSWNGDSNITRALFLNNVTPNSTAWWFDDLPNLTEIENINYLNTANVTDMRTYVWTAAKN